MPAGLWVVLCACQAAPVGEAWVQGRHFTAFGGRGGVLRADVKKPRRWRLARPECRSVRRWRLDGYGSADGLFRQQSVRNFFDFVTA